MPRVRTAARLIAVLALLSCGDSVGPVVPAAIVVNPNHPSIGQGLQLQLTGTVVDAAGRAIRGLVPTFTSGNNAVATVTLAGLVTAVGPVATVTITAGYQGITTSVDLMVTQRAVTLSVTPSALVMNRNALAWLSVTAVDFIGNPVFSEISLTSLDPSVAGVTNSGLVTAGANPGATEIVVTAAGLNTRVPVTVTIIPTTIEVEPLNVILPPGGTRQLTATVKDAVGAVIAGATPDFATTAPTVFSVSPAGLVTSLGPGGSGTVRLTYGALAASVGVFVGTIPSSAVTAHTLLVGAPYGAAVGPAGQVVVSQAAGSSAGRGTLPATTFPAIISTGIHPLGVAINPTGTRAYLGVEGGISVIDLSSNTALPPVTGLTGQVFDVKVSPDGQVIYAATETRVYRIDAGSQMPLGSVAANTATWLIVHPTLPRIYATYLGVQAVVELDATTLLERRRFLVGGTVQGLALRHDGTELFVAGEGPAKLDVWDLATGTRIQEAPLAGGGFGVVVAQDLIVVTESQAGRVELLDLASRISLATLTVGGVPRRLALNGAGTVVVVPNEAGWVDFIE